MYRGLRGLGYDFKAFRNERGEDDLRYVPEFRVTIGFFQNKFCNPKNPEPLPRLAIRHELHPPPLGRDCGLGFWV